MLQVHFHRKFSAFILACSTVVLISGGIGLVGGGNALPVVVQFLAWAILAAMVWGIVVGLRQLRRPPLMYTADRRGVMIYYDAERIRFTERGVFLPWKLVTSLNFEERTGIGASGERSKTWVIACTLRENAPFPVQRHSVAYGPQDGEQVVCLDAFVGTISRQKLLDSLRPLWQAGFNEQGDNGLK